MFEVRSNGVDSRGLFTRPLRLAAVCIFVVAGCQQAAEESPTAVTDTMQDFGDYTLHFNAMTTDRLTAEIAQRHGIVRSGNRAMLNVSIVRKREGAIGMPVPGTVEVSAANLTGQLKPVSLREITEAEAIYYIGESSVADGETLVYSIVATPVDAAAPMSVRYMKQFFVD